jgi:HlyD family secretion protein
MEGHKMKIPAVAFIIVAALVMVSCGGNNQYPGGSGFIEATEIVISSEAAGQIVSLEVDEGDLIAAGDTIGKIDTVTVMLRLVQAESRMRVSEATVNTSSLSIEQASYNLDLATKEYDRVSALLKSGSIDQQHFDKVETAYHQAALSKKQADAAYQAALADLARTESDVELLKKQVSDCFPRSPASGVITAKFVEAGELIGTGRPLVKIAKLDTVWVKVYLPPSDLTRIKLGDAALVDPEDGNTKPLEGKVSWISDEAEFTPKNVQTKEARADLVYAVKIVVPNPEKVLKIGMPVSVKIQ